MPWDVRGALLQVRDRILSFAPRRRAALLASALVALGACQGPRPRAGDAAPSSAERGDPAWIHAPLSWEKLDAIERWLESADSVHDQGLLLEAHLQLAEGRVEITRRDRERGAGHDPAARARLLAAQGDLAAVREDARATPGQRTRATLSAERATRLLSDAAPVAASSPAGLLGVVPRTLWRARPPRTSDMTPVGGPWRRITVHHSAEIDDTSPSASMSDSAATLQRIQKVHMDRGDPSHGWADIGYHFLIDGSGRVFEGRSLDWQGAHARGANNRQNIGVCLLGDYSRQAPGRAELDALERLLDELRQRYRLPAKAVTTHRELTATACPGPSLQAWVERYRRRGVASNGS